MILDEFLKVKKIFGILGIDMCVFIKIICKYGIMCVILIYVGDSMDYVIDQFQVMVLLIDNIKQVFIKIFYLVLGVGLSVVLVDFGFKYLILCEFLKCNCNVIVVLYMIMVEEIFYFNFDGVMLLNGLGNLEDVF